MAQLEPKPEHNQPKDSTERQLKAFTQHDSAAVFVDNDVRAKQSRNPIRRSYSERHHRPHNLQLHWASPHEEGASPLPSYYYHYDYDYGPYGYGNSNSSGSSRNSDEHKVSSENNNDSSKINSMSRCKKDICGFQDTMALRTKSNRSDTRNLFALPPPMAGMCRPREPPPPPPTPSTTSPPTTPPTTALVAIAEESTIVGATTGAAVAADKNTGDARPIDALSVSPAAPAQPRRAGGRSTTLIAVESCNSVTTNGFDNHQLPAPQQGTPDKPIAGDVHYSNNNNKKYINNNDNNNSNNKPNDQRRQPQSNGASCQDINDGDTSASSVMLPFKHYNNNSSNHRRSQPLMAMPTTRTITAATPLSSRQTQSKSNGSGQRTVVRVAPFNKRSSEVHRLKISHTDDNHTAEISHSHLPHPQSPQQHQQVAVFGAAQKRTSILINGDDCYSTMNLGSDASTPLYHSSVVVADYSVAGANGPYEGLKVTTTSNTVTINVCSPRSSAEKLIYQHNQINTFLSRQATADDGGGSGDGRAIIPIRGANAAAEINLQRSSSSTSSTSTSSMTSISSSASTGSGSGSGGGCCTTPKRGRTLIRLDYSEQSTNAATSVVAPAIIVDASPAMSTAGGGDLAVTFTQQSQSLLAHEQELLKILRNPVEAVKRNLVPHVCGRSEVPPSVGGVARSKKMKETSGGAALPAAVRDETGVKPPATPAKSMEPISGGGGSSGAILLRRASAQKVGERSSFIAKLLEDPTLSQVAEGLETETVVELIENSLRRLKQSRHAIDISGTKDSDDMNRLINLSLQKIREERQAVAPLPAPPQTPLTEEPNEGGGSESTGTHLTVPTKDEDRHSNRGSISSANSFASAHNYEMFEFEANESDCYQSCSSEITSATGDDDTNSSAATRSKFYQMLVDATLAEIEMSTHVEEDGDDADDDEHHYESIRHGGDPIYEEIGDVPPPLPLTAPPVNDPESEKKAARSIFEGASKYDILSYLVDAKERGVVHEESFDYPLSCSNPIIIEEEAGDTLSDLGKRKQKQKNALSSHASFLSDSSEDNQCVMSSLSPPPHTFICGSSLLQHNKCASSDIERNDSGVGSETSKSSRNKYQQSHPGFIAVHSHHHHHHHATKHGVGVVAGVGGVGVAATMLHLCEDCDGAVETQLGEAGGVFAPLVCRKCGKKRVERKEIMTEIVETEEKYGRDLQIILEEFCHPMLVAGLLTQEQLSAIFLNTEELLENNQTLAERMRDALDIALEQGDDDLLTVNIGRIFLDFTQMLHAFESYCVRQAGASLLLANLEKEKELLRIFLKVSQMENAVLRRMNLNSFLMVPVQRVTKYPLLLARLYKVTPSHLDGRDQLKQAQEKIELHLNHINQEAKDVPTKLWRRISSSSPNRRASCEIDMINIKLRKMAIDVLEWNHDEVRFAMEGKLLYTQPTDSNWKKARTIKLTPVNALLVTNGKPSANYKAEKVMTDKLNFPKHTGIREASLLLVKEKCGRYTLIREPLYLDRCVVCSEADWDDYFEVQEISSKDTFIFKAEDGVRTKQWYTQLQFHAQGMGAWRKRRNALANIMINGMLARS